MSKIVLSALQGRFAVVRLPQTTAAMPEWAVRAEGATLLSITRTADELSIVCDEHIVPESIIALGTSGENETSETSSNDVLCERDWSALKVHGPLDFGLTGVLSSMASPLANVGIPIFVMSTYDTDYLMVKANNLMKAISVLKEEGFDVKDSTI